MVDEIVTEPKSTGSPPLKKVTVSGAVEFWNMQVMEAGLLGATRLGLTEMVGRRPVQGKHGERLVATLDTNL